MPYFRQFEVTIAKMVDEIIEKRYEDRKFQIEALNLPPDKKREELLALEERFEREANLIDLSTQKNNSDLNDFLDEFYDNFSKDCLLFNKTLTDAEMEKMFLDLIKLIYTTKLKILDSYLEADLRQRIAHVQDIPHENARLIMWSVAQEEASIELMNELEKIFLPVLEDAQNKKIGLFTQHGKHRAVKVGSISQHPPSYIIGESENELESLFLLHAEDKNSPAFGIDRGLRYLLWSALSSHYVQQSDLKNINVFLPDGDIATSSTFWNYELNVARKLNLEAGGKIKFYKLKPLIQKELNEINETIRVQEKKIEPKISNFGKIKENESTIFALRLKRHDAETALAVLVLQRNFEKDMAKKENYPEDSLKRQAYDEEESNLKKQIKELEEAINPLTIANNNLLREYYERENEIPQVREEINSLYQKKEKLCALRGNWESIPFEQLQFKGLKLKHKPFTVKDKPTEQPFTVAHMMKVGEILKKRLNEKRMQKEEAKTKGPKPKIHPLLDAEALKSKEKESVKIKETPPDSPKKQRP